MLHASKWKFEIITSKLNIKRERKTVKKMMKLIFASFFVPIFCGEGYDYRWEIARKFQKDIDLKISIKQTFNPKL